MYWVSKYDLERYTHTDLIFSLFYLKVLSSHVLFRNITKYHGNDNYTAVIAHYDVLYIDFKRTIIRTITKELLFSSKLICNSQTSKFKIYTCTDNHSLDAIPWIQTKLLIFCKSLFNIIIIILYYNVYYSIV